jgi:hypothetical protein
MVPQSIVANNFDLQRGDFAHIFADDERPQYLAPPALHSLEGDEALVAPPEAPALDDAGAEPQRPKRKRPDTQNLEERNERQRKKALAKLQQPVSNNYNKIAH